MAQDSKWNLFSSTLHAFICLISSYYYAYKATFIDHSDWQINLAIGFEAFFGVMMVQSCFLEYIPVGKTTPVRNFKMTAMNYLKTSFVLDFIPLVPLNNIDRITGLDMHGHQNYFFLIKCSRMINAIQLFNINKLMSHLKKLN